MRSKIFMGLLIAVVIPLGIVGSMAFMGLIDTPTNPTTITDVLVSSAVVLNQQVDSTAAFPWNGNVMRIAIMPGYNDTTFFSQATARALGDSYTCMFYIRGWTTSARKQLMFQTPLWSGSAPFKGVIRPRSNINSALVRTQVDSFSRTVVSTRDYAGAYTAGTGTWDSLRVDMVNLRNDGYQRIEWAPYYDIVKYDSVAKCGFRHRAKVVVTQYK